MVSGSKRVRYESKDQEFGYRYCSHLGFTCSDNCIWNQRSTSWNPNVVLVINLLLCRQQEFPM